MFVKKMLVNFFWFSLEKSIINLGAFIEEIIKRNNRKKFSFENTTEIEPSYFSSSPSQNC